MAALSAGQGSGDFFHLGAPASHVRGDPAPVPRRRRRHEPARGQAQRFCGVHCQPRADCLDRSAPVVNRIIVGAHYGLKDWLAQRVTALVMLVYTVLFLVVWPRPMAYAAWKDLFAQEWMRLATFLLVASVLIHAWICVRNIWMDYVKHTGLRLGLQVATILWLVGCAGWAIQILWRI